MPASDQGVMDKKYVVVPRVLVFLTQRNRVLLIKGAEHKRLWANRYNGVGGHLEAGEDVLTAAVREVREETGLHVEDLQLGGVVTVNTAVERGVLIFIFKSDNFSGELTESPEGKLNWIAVDDLTDLALVEDLPLVLPRLLALQPGQPPFFASYSYANDGRLLIRFSTPGQS